MNQPEFKEKHATRAKSRGKHALTNLPFGFGFPFDWLKKKNGRFGAVGFSIWHMQRFLTKIAGLIKRNITQRNF